jgi:hypothetical protein
LWAISNPVMEYKGILIPVGGNEDKGLGSKDFFSLDFITDGILSRIVRESGGTEARIVIITGLWRFGMQSRKNSGYPKTHGCQ